MKEYAKVKTAAKTITYSGPQLKTVILNTVKMASNLVGSTLGPNGRTVLIERQESLPPYVTKDGITVFKSMALSDPTAQAVLEAVRDSSSKTNVEAGDGTTTATVLAEALISNGYQELDAHPNVSSQKVMREMESIYEEVIVPFVNENCVKITNDNADDLLRKVALISTNNDQNMTDAVLECFNRVGYNGNITIAETQGSSGFEVEKIEGFPIARGFEDTCGRFMEEFVNDKSNYRILLDRPRFLLYNGKLNTLSTILPAIEKIGVAYDQAIASGAKFSPNIVVVAHHFSDEVLAQLAYNFKNPSSLNIVPLKTYMTALPNSPYHFLNDLACFTGATVFDPISKPLETFELQDLGSDKMEVFECYRYRSLVLGEPDEFLVLTRAEEIERLAEQAESSLDAELLRERLAILTGGIARLKVKGSSEAELKEKKHRVEDAVSAIKGALKYGVLPGCAKTALTLSILVKKYDKASDITKRIVSKSLLAPFRRIMYNCGLTYSEAEKIRLKMLYGVSGQLSIEQDEDSLDLKQFWNTYNVLENKFGHGIDIGVIDSAAAVLMAIKNSFSVAKMLMGLSGIVVFKRDHELERSYAMDIYSEERDMERAERASEFDKWQVD